jgi:hypothetical protein
MSFGDVFKLTLKGTLLGQQTNNVFHYRQTVGILGGSTMVDRFLAEVFPDIKSVLASQATFTAVEWINYNDPSDFGLTPITTGQNGARSGEVLPAFIAWGFNYNRSSRVTRNGSKRFAGVMEGDVINGLAVPAFLNVLEDVAGQLGQDLQAGLTEMWRPVIARISTDGATVIQTNDVQNVTYRRITTQNSRKPYT